MRIAILFLIVTMLSLPASSLAGEKTTSKSQFKEAAFILVPTGAFIAGLGILFKFEKEETLREDGTLDIRRVYDARNYALMSTGASCTLVGIALLIAAYKQDNPQISYYRLNSSSYLIAEWHF